ncbi:hypothetical protein FSP39_004917 [Pinctada imbricata]|uniref:Tetraspanin n=1 Tax=Pinctada imbricata TaxID=66713 RepID=A0AA88YDT8_PINIB|nr:hypothetical protein FSP39_004917 [Pinctada imbricata]
MDKGHAKSLAATAPAVACMKLMLMIFNFVFWVTGIAILAIGIWTKVDLYKYMELSSIYYKESPYVLIGVGAVIVVVGSLGCCCTMKGNSCLLYMYAGFLVIVFVAELSAGCTGFIYKGKLEKGFKEGLTNAIKKYGSNDDITVAMDNMQKQLHCCGNSAYTDWFNSTWGSGKNYSVPESCCRSDVSTVCQNVNVKTVGYNASIYTEGCASTVIDFMQAKMGMIGGVALGISFFQLFGALLACCLAKNINRSKYEQVA